MKEYLAAIKHIYNYWQYAKNLKDENIVIITNEVKYRSEFEEGLKPMKEAVKDKFKPDAYVDFSRYLIRGKVDSVFPFPPAFNLRNVKEEVIVKRVTLRFKEDSNGSVDISDTYVSEQGNITLRKTKEKFISFSAIDQIEKEEDFETEN